VTGWGEELQVSPKERQSADFVIAKPFTLEAIQEVIARVRREPPEA